jgi:hypothetical protein
MPHNPRASAFASFVTISLDNTLATGFFVIFLMLVNGGPPSWTDRMQDRGTCFDLPDRVHA